MKDILEIKFRGQCKWPVAERDGRHLFCAEPAATEKCPYCLAHAKRAGLPTRFYADTKSLADSMAGGISRAVSQAETHERKNALAVPVDQQIAAGVALFDRHVVRKEPA